MQAIEIRPKYTDNAIILNTRSKQPNQHNQHNQYNKHRVNDKLITLAYVAQHVKFTLREGTYFPRF